MILDHLVVEVVLLDTQEMVVKVVTILQVGVLVVLDKVVVDQVVMQVLPNPMEEEGEALRMGSQQVCQHGMGETVGHSLALSSAAS